MWHTGASTGWFADRFFMSRKNIKSAARAITSEGKRRYKIERIARYDRSVEKTTRGGKCCYNLDVGLCLGKGKVEGFRSLIEASSPITNSPSRYYTPKNILGLSLSMYKTVNCLNILLSLLTMAETNVVLITIITLSSLFLPWKNY